MKSNKLFRAAAGLLIAANILAFTACSQQAASASPVNPANGANAASNGQTTIYGKVTAVDGAKITLALGTLNMPNGGQQGNNSGNNSGSSNRTGSRPSGGFGGQQASGASRPQRDGTGSRSSSGFRQGGNGWQGGDLLTMTGETKTITITDTGIITKPGMRGGFGGGQRNGQGRTSGGQNGTASNAQNTSVQNSEPTVVNTTSDTSSSAQVAGNGANGQNSASLSDISVGTILRVTYETSSEKLVSVQIMGETGGGQSASSEQSS